MSFESTVAAAVETVKEAISDAVAPRRSSRISAHPKQAFDPAPKEKKARASKKSAKRSADDDGKDDEGNKKMKADDEGASGAVEKADQDELDAPILSPINIGDSLPSLILKNEKDEDVDVASIAQDKGVVLFLVPKADTPGCTQQACGFRDVWEDFTASNFDVYCLSADSSTAQLKWQTKKTLPYGLLSDSNRVLIGALGAADGNKTKRSHFIFEKGGKLVDKKIPVKPADSPKSALEFIKNLQSS